MEELVLNGRQAKDQLIANVHYLLVTHAERDESERQGQFERDKRTDIAGESGARCSSSSSSSSSSARIPPSTNISDVTKTFEKMVASRLIIAAPTIDVRRQLVNITKVERGSKGKGRAAVRGVSGGVGEAGKRTLTASALAAAKADDDSIDDDVPEEAMAEGRSNTAAAAAAAAAGTRTSTARDARDLIRYFLLSLIPFFSPFNNNCAAGGSFPWNRRCAEESLELRQLLDGAR